MLHYVTLRSVTLSLAILCYIMLRYVMLYFIWLFFKDCSLQSFRNSPGFILFPVMYVILQCSVMLRNIYVTL